MRDAKNAANDGLNNRCGTRAQFIYPTRAGPDCKSPLESEKLLAIALPEASRTELGEKARMIHAVVQWSLLEANS